MNRLKLAVVGAGHLGSIHARLAAGLEEIELVAVVDPCSATCSTVAAKCGTRAVADYRELIGEIDAAVIAAPTSTHYSIASDLLRAGVHCLVEKPLTPVASEAEQLVNLARRRQTVLQVGHVERFNPAFTRVRARLADPKYIEARRHSAFTFRSIDVGVVLDLMIHDIDAALSLIRSPVVKVDALGIAVLSEFEDMASARLHFASGAVANLSASRVNYRAERTMQVFTSRRFASIDFAAREARLIEPDDAVLRRQLNLESLSADQQQAVRERLFDDVLPLQSLPAEDANAIELELLDFANAIAAGRSPKVTGEDGRDAVAVAELILEAIALHQWDGAQVGRCGPQAMPALPILQAAPASWATDETVVPRRKAG